MTPLDYLTEHLEEAWKLALDVAPEGTSDRLSHITFSIGKFLGPERCFELTANHIRESGR